MTAPRESDKVVAGLNALCQPGWTVVHVGCLDGFELAGTIAGHTGCRAIGFEANVAERIFGTVEYHEVAIGATDCEAVYYSHGSLGCGSLYNRGGDTKTVTVRRLDTLLPELSATPAMLIIDTEGTAYDVLEGAGSLLGDVQVIYAECQTSPMYDGGRLLSDVDAMLTPLGFSLVRSTPAYDVGSQGNYLWVRP